MSPLWDGALVQRLAVLHASTHSLESLRKIAGGEGGRVRAVLSARSLTSGGRRRRRGRSKHRTKRRASHHEQGERRSRGSWSLRQRGATCAGCKSSRLESSLAQDRLKL